MKYICVAQFNETSTRSFDTILKTLVELLVWR